MSWFCKAPHMFLFSILPSWPICSLAAGAGCFTVLHPYRLTVVCAQEEFNKYVMLVGTEVFIYFFLNIKLICKSKPSTLFHTGKLSQQQLFFTNHSDYYRMDAIIIKVSKSNFLLPVVSTSPMSYYIQQL